MSSNVEKHGESFLETRETSTLPDEAPPKDQKLSPDDNNSPEVDVLIGSDENVNEAQANKETASVKSGEVAQQTPNNLSETTSPKASCSYQDFG